MNIVDVWSYLLQAERACAMAKEVVTNHTGDVLFFVLPASNSDIGDGDGCETCVCPVPLSTSTFAELRLAHPTAN